MIVLLTLKSKNDAVSDYEIDIDRFPFTIGRHPDCDEQILQPMISRKHCQFIQRDYAVWIHDLESRHGTLVNGERITTPRRLRHGDVITLPCGEFWVQLVEVLV